MAFFLKVDRFLLHIYSNYGGQIFFDNLILRLYFDTVWMDFISFWVIRRDCFWSIVSFISFGFMCILIFLQNVIKRSDQDAHSIYTFGRLGPAFKIDETPADQLDPTASYNPRIARA